METFTKEQFWAELEKTGEDKVRERVIAKVYGAGNHKLALAEEWLRVQEKRRTDAAAAAAHKLNLENLRNAKSATKAAWVAAICAVIAIVISFAVIVFTRTAGG